MTGMNDLESSERAGYPARPARTAGDYVGALRRRWLPFMLVTGLFSAAGIAFTLLQTPIYLANTRVLIEPPREIVQGISNAPTNSQAASAFFNTRLQLLQSRQIAAKVFDELKIDKWDDLNGVEDPVGELLGGWLTVKQVKDSNLVDISLRSTDPQLAAKFLNTTYEEFRKLENESMKSADSYSRSRIKEQIDELKVISGDYHRQLADFFKNNQQFSPNGENTEATKLQMLDAQRVQAAADFAKMKREFDSFRLMVQSGTPPLSDHASARMVQARSELKMIDEDLKKAKNIYANYETHPVVARLKADKSKIESAIGEELAIEAESKLAMMEQELKAAEESITALDKLAEEKRKLIAGQQDAMNKLASLQNGKLSIEEMIDKFAKESLRINSSLPLTLPRIEQIDVAEVPKQPIRPIKEIQIPLVVLVSLLLGAATAIGLDFMDNRIRSTDQLRASLNWPILASMPIFGGRELAINGQRTFASELPGSRPFEAFRNLRMSILGAETREPLRSILVTSLKATEGKSFVASNLAATCARAGESVLLVDVDLRSPNLNTTFRLANDSLGLIDVLDGNIPWEKAAIATEVANLTVMPTGDATGIPVEVLGTAEMHSLLVEWMARFDRVILDGPASFSLADSREVGRFSDGVLMVLRPNAHDAKMLDQVRRQFELEGIRPAGVVFNGSTDMSYQPPQGRPMSRQELSERRQRKLQASGTNAA